MAEHTWTEGKGLRNGLPDSGWPMRKFITVYPVQRGYEDDAHLEWKVSICWGDTWGHIAFGEDEDFTTAMKEACAQAMKGGCPPEWLPFPSPNTDLKNQYGECRQLNTEE